MSYVSDRLYREVIVKMMARLASVVRVREIMPHLTCLTFTDKEEIEAKRDMAGNYNAMVMLLDYLRRRQNWPEEFICALRACEHWDLADAINNAYDEMRGINHQAPASVAAARVGVATATPPPPLPPMSPSAPAPSTSASVASVPMAVSTTVTTATIHSVPRSASPLLTPEGLPVQGAHNGSVPDTIPTAQAIPFPLNTPLHSVVLVSDPQQRAPSPVLAHEDVHSLGQNEVSVNPGTSALGTLSGPPSDSAPCLPAELLTTPSSLSNTPSTTLQSSVAPERSKEPLVTTGSPNLLKHPIQDSHPPAKGSGSSTANQLVDRLHTTVPNNCQTQPTSLGTERVPSSASDGPIGGQLDHTDVADEYLSKPGALLVEEPVSITSDDLEISHATTEIEVPTMEPTPVSSFPLAEEHFQVPCSTSSADLMISSASAKTTDSSPVQHTDNIPVEKSFPEVVPDMPTDSDPVSNPGAHGHSVSDSTHEVSTRLENGLLVDPSSNQPVEDHYESFSPSLQPGTLVISGHLSENPSIPNLDACSPSIKANVIDTNDMSVSPNHNTQYNESVIPPFIFEHQPTVNNQGSSELNESAGINSPQSELREEARWGLLAQLQTDPRLIAAAAAVIGVTAVFFAWRLKPKY
ncbi:mitochondrial antiviral-signaling protein [Brachyhypopomus gauderio]|uniref:mitochondrial antiviral-signaling protein n=1 Tax=Brachyhypopomus gauderio TaxID=698409 RepID=UPI004041A617